MSLLDKVVATEADAIKQLALVKVGVDVSSGSLAVVGVWADWRQLDLKNTMAALVPGTPAPAVQAALALAQTALNQAGSKALSPMERYVAMKKAEAAVGALALVVLS